MLLLNSLCFKYLFYNTDNYSIHCSNEAIDVYYYPVICLHFRYYYTKIRSRFAQCQLTKLYAVIQTAGRKNPLISTRLSKLPPDDFSLLIFGKHEDEL
jgi:hypothetical protein